MLVLIFFKLFIISLFFQLILSQTFDIKSFVKSHGYKIEKHADIPTEDGYLLTMFRIPGAKNSTKSIKAKPPILLMHGLMGSCENYVVLGPGKAFAFYLADLGYDVWLGNTRGTFHGRKHISLDPDKNHKKFFNFSWHEIGIYDLPALIDYIRALTGYKKIYYSGHSQGTTSFTVMASERPEYNQRIRLMCALAPPVFFANVPHPGLRIFHTPGLLLVLQKFAELVGLYELGFDKLVMQAVEGLCTSSAVQKEICANLMFVADGYDSPQFDRELIKPILQSVPGGASIKQMFHYGQLIRSGGFNKYDHGVVGNLKKYWSIRPPSYNLTNVVVPMALFYGENDWLVSIKDRENLVKILPNLVLDYRVPLADFTHLDFIFATDAISLVYEKCVSVMKQFPLHK